jgi:hypothetical protein
MQQRLALSPAAEQIAGSQFFSICRTWRRIAFQRLICRASSCGMRRPM